MGDTKEGRDKKGLDEERRQREHDLEVAMEEREKGEEGAAEPEAEEGEGEEDEEEEDEEEEGEEEEAEEVEPGGAEELEEAHADDED